MTSIDVFNAVTLIGWSVSITGEAVTVAVTEDERKPTMPFYLTPKQDDFNKIPELQVCIAEALYDVDSIVADPGAYTKEQLTTLHSQIVSNLERRRDRRAAVHCN